MMTVAPSFVRDNVKTGKFVPYPIEGIPKGKSFIYETNKTINDLFQRGYLIAYKEHGILVSNSVIVYHLDDNTEEIEKEHHRAEQQLLENYNKL